MKKIIFSTAELNQLLSYIEYVERIGWYYGNKEHFEKRHISIKEKLNNLKTK
jgi:hypothetical protein